MSDVLRLAMALVEGSTGPDKVDEVYKELHWLGLRGSTRGLTGFLDVLESLELVLLRFQELYPNLTPAIQRLLRAAKLKERICQLQLNPSELDLSAPNAWCTNPSKPCWPLPPRPALPIEIPLHKSDPQSVFLFTAALILDVVWTPYSWSLDKHSAAALELVPKLLSRLPHAIEWPNWDDLIKDRDTFSTQDARYLQEMNLACPLDLSTVDSPKPLAELTLHDCIKSITDDYRLRIKQHGFKSDNGYIVYKYQRHFENIEKLLRDVVLDDSFHPKLENSVTLLTKLKDIKEDLRKTTPDDKDWRWGRRATVELSDRKLMSEHNSALTSKMKNDIFKYVYDSKFNSQLNTLGIHGLDEVTSYLLGIGLPTGSLITEVLILRVMPHSELVEANKGQSLTKGVISHEISALDVTQRIYYWNPPGRPATRQLQLRRPPNWPAHCTNFCVLEMLRLQSARFIKIIEARAANLIHRRVPTSRLAFKHALGRSLYAIDTNRALIRYICGPKNGGSGSDPQGTSLHHYLDASSETLNSAYQIAQLKIYDLNATKEEARFREGVEAEKACIRIPPERLNALLSSLRKGLNRKELNLIEQHNHYVKYVATILLLSTGHRETTELYYFWFSLNLDEKVAFIADKQKMGSEARFIALPQTAIDQILAYRKHLTWLIDQLAGVNDELADKIRIACGLSQLSNGDEEVTYPFLFTIRQDQLISIKTHGLAHWLSAAERALGHEEIVDSEITARLLRRNLATYLSNRGVSGNGVEFALGHNGSLHAWGVASHRIPKRRLKILATLLDEYLIANGATSASAPWVDSRYRKFHEIEPLQVLSNTSYELRKTQTDEARARARAAILSVLTPEDLGESSLVVIDHETLDLIRAEVTEVLAHDGKAQGQVLTELGKLVSYWKAMKKIDCKAALLNLTRIHPGPIDVVFGRHLAIATKIQERLPKAIVSFLPKNNKSIEKLLAVIAILLPATEAVLNLVDIQALINALQMDGARQFESQVRLRATVETRNAIYERTCDLSDNGCAAVTGYLRLKAATPPLADPKMAEITWTDLMPHIEAFLVHLQGPQPTLTLEQLLSVLKPYWILRLTGTAYACCVGEYHSSSESAQSTQLILSGHSPDWAEIPKRFRRASLDKTSEIAMATKAANNVIRTIQGKKDLFTANKRAQRKALRTFFEEGLNEDTRLWIDQQSIFELWMEFLHHLLEEGGPNVSKYAPSSLGTYQTAAMQYLFIAGWDSEITEMDSAELDAFYTKAFEAADASQHGDLKKVLKIFHEFLRDQHDMPSCKEFPSGIRRKHKARNEILSKETINKAISLAYGSSKYARGTDKEFGNYSHAASAFLSFGAIWGLRPSEAYSAQHRQFDFANHLTMGVRRNRASSVKTASGARLVPICIGSRDLQLQLGSYCFNSISQYIYKSGKELLSWIFTDPDDDEKLIGWTKTRAISSWALKTATGNISTVYYSQRHTYATAVAWKLLCPAPQSPIVKAVGEKLPDINNEAFAKLSPPPSIYGKSIDRLGMWLGHSGVDTFVKTYGHCIWWSASDSCYVNAQQTQWSETTYARLIGIDRTTINKLKKPFPVESTSTETNFIVSNYLKGLLPNLVETNNAGSVPIDRFSLPPIDPDITFLEPLFAYRHMDGFEPSVISGILERDHRLTKASSESLVRAYRQVVNGTGFTDFEPQADKTGRSLRRGVKRLASPRIKLIRKIARLSSQDANFEYSSSQVSKLWRLHVVIEAPGIIVTDTKDASHCIDWLLQLGYEKSGLLITHFNASQEQVSELDATGVSMAKSEIQLGLVKQVIPASEYRVVPVSSDKLPVAHNFQRILFALSVWDCFKELVS